MRLGPKLICPFILACLEPNLVSYPPLTLATPAPNPVQKCLFKKENTPKKRKLMVQKSWVRFIGVGVEKSKEYTGN